METWAICNSRGRADYCRLACCARCGVSQPPGSEALCRQEAPAFTEQQFQLTLKHVMPIEHARHWK
jgi:hypothetical protein